MNNEEKILGLLEKHGEMLSRMQADMADMKETLKQHGKRLEHLDERMEHLDERSQRTALLLEVEYKQKLDLLYEGHGTIMESLDRLASKSRVETLESEVALLKHAIKLLRLEIADLKKAQ